jgi:hypothetical protein
MVFFLETLNFSLNEKKIEPGKRLVRLILSLLKGIYR